MATRLLFLSDKRCPFYSEQLFNRQCTHTPRSLVAMATRTPLDIGNYSPDCLNCSAWPLSLLFKKPVKCRHAKGVLIRKSQQLQLSIDLELAAISTSWVGRSEVYSQFTPCLPPGWSYHISQIPTFRSPVSPIRPVVVAFIVRFSTFRALIWRLLGRGVAGCGVWKSSCHGNSRLGR